MKLIRFSALLSFTALMATSLVFGKDPECRFRYFAFDQDHLDCLKNSEPVKSIRKNFLELLSNKKDCPQCEDPRGLSKFVHLFAKEFLAIEIREQGFGGLTVAVLFKGEPRVYHLWLYPIEAGNYQVRDITPTTLDKKATQQMLEYASEVQYSKYWTPGVKQ